MLRSVGFDDVIKDFAFAKSRKRTFLIVYCIVFKVHAKYALVSV